MPLHSPQLVDDGPALVQAGLVHRVAPPAGTGPHPTVIMLHGRSGGEDVMWIFARTLPAGWLLVAPRAIRHDPDGGYAWHPRHPAQWPSLTQFDEAVARLVQFMDALPGLYGADLQRVYLMGFSQGAALSYALAMRYPGRVQGIAGLVGFVPTGCEDVVRLAPLLDLPVFMAVGKEDPTIPYNRSLASAQTLRAAGAALTYREYDTGHKLTPAGLRDLTTWWPAIAR